jgi:hypothetical protein
LTDPFTLTRVTTSLPICAFNKAISGNNYLVSTSRSSY